MTTLMTYTNGCNKVTLYKLSHRDYAISCKHGDVSTAVKVDAETIRNMARCVEHEEAKRGG